MAVIGRSSQIVLKDSDVLQVPRGELIDGSSFPADVYLRLGESKYVLLARQGDRANLSQLHIAEDVPYFYVVRHEYKNFVGRNISIAGIVIGRNEISNERKTEFIARAAASVFKELEDLGISHESIEHARLVSRCVKILVEAKPDIFAMLTVMANVPGDLLRHSIAVSAVSVMIARGLGWTLQTTMEKLAMGGLLHDIGLKEMPREILEKPRFELTYDQQLLFETHPFRGAEMLKAMPSVTDELIAIVYEHQENAVGQGYPRHLRDVKINPLARIVGLADAFVELTVTSTANPRPRTGPAALEYMETVMGQLYHKPAYQALKKIMTPVKGTKAG